VSFRTPIPPEKPETKPASEVTATSATLHGVLNPGHEQEAGTYEFLYKASATECRSSGALSAPKPRGVLLTAKGQVVSVGVNGLLPATQYAFCLLARNGAGEEALGPAETFTTPTAPPVIADTGFTSVTASTAVVSAQINPGGLAAGYRVEYVTDAQFKLNGFTEATSVPVPDAALPAGSSPVPVSEHLSGLAPGTEYEFRFLAHNTLQTVAGQTVTLVTNPASPGCANEALRTENFSLALPDCRAYEAASPLNAPGEVYFPNSPFNGTEEGRYTSNEPFQAAAAGEEVIYGGDPLVSGGSGVRANGHGDALLAIRAPGGWHATDIQPPQVQGEALSEAQQTVFQAYLFAPLSLGVLSADSAALATSASPRAPVCTTFTHALFARSSDGSNHALFSGTQSPQGECGYPLFVGSSGSGFFFQTEAALTPGGVEDPSNAEHEFSGCVLNCSLYESTGAHLSLVNVLPGGGAAPHATFGAPPLEGAADEEEPDLSHAISTGGSRTYWTDEETGVVYMRRNPSQVEGCAVPADACTVQVSAGSARYWTASPDGRYAYYTKAGGLWRFDAATGEPLQLVEGKDEVQGVLGINEEGEDGGYLYFVAGGALPGTGAETRVCQQAKKEGGTAEEAAEFLEEEEGKLPARRGCNLYLLHSGKPALIGTLSPRDNTTAQAGLNTHRSVDLIGGDWRPALGRRTAAPTPDGHSLVFESTLPLTGYDTTTAHGRTELNGRLEVFVYDAGAARLSCASCNPAGESPQPLFGNTVAFKLPASNAATYMRRWISADGSRVFFNTSQPLVAADANGAQDVYEWERPGWRSCAMGSPVNGGGCVSLISGGVGLREAAGTDGGASHTSESAFFVDASVSGSDVFFITRAPLMPGAGYETSKLFDAREGGGFPVPAGVSAGCAGDACRGAGTGAPSGSGAGSSLFAGPGNLAPASPSPVVGKRRSAAEVRTAALAKALRACRAKGSRRVRAVCEARARRRYGPPHTVKRASRAGHATNRRGGK
jgi:hypothetical protein